MYKIKNSKDNINLQQNNNNFDPPQTNNVGGPGGFDMLQTYNLLNNN
jgi:hypothetical protein